MTECEYINYVFQQSGGCLHLTYHSCCFDLLSMYTSLHHDNIVIDAKNITTVANSSEHGDPSQHRPAPGIYGGEGFEGISAVRNLGDGCVCSDKSAAAIHQLRLYSLIDAMQSNVHPNLSNLNVFFFLSDPT